MGRVLSGFLLTLVLAALLVPLGLYAGPPVLAALEHRQPERQEPVPAYQRSPAALGSAAEEFPVPAGAAAPLPAEDELAELLDAELTVAGDGEFSGAVLDVLTGDVLYDNAGAVPVAPASSLKILTAAAALSQLGADTRFETAVYAGAEAGTVVLTGGGDVLLTAGASQVDDVVGHAGLQDLAEETAAALAAAGAADNVRILVDDTLFTGDTLSPAWNPDDIEAGEAAALAPLAVNSAWATEGIQYGPRVDDPALAAAEAFARALDAAAAGYGISVDPVVDRGTADAGADLLATVESATVAEQVRQMLLVSDNYLAEALARMTALAAGEAATFDGGTQAILAAVSGLGVDTAGMVLADASGLGAGTEVSARQLAAAVQAALTSGNNDVRGLASSLPVAGLSGSLANRFLDPDAPASDITAPDDGAGGDAGSAAGLVRAKTGTLFAVTSLSGFVTDADGRLLAFAFVANGLDANTAGARAAVDAAAAVLAGCGCR